MTSFRKFILGIGACFFFPWLCLVILPSAKMNADVKTWADPDTGQVNAFPAGNLIFLDKVKSSMLRKVAPHVILK